MNLISTSAILWFTWLLYTLSSVYGNSEGDALYAFRTQLSDPNNVLQSWDPTLVNPCTWFHVTCNNQNSVTRVDLGNANLSGRLASQLGQLANLQYLEIFGNNFTGRIPEEIGNLTSLVSLDLFLNRFEGHIPKTLGKLQKLRYLEENILDPPLFFCTNSWIGRLNNNNLTGPIPYSLTTITTLEVLDLSNNHLRGYVPANGSFAYFTPISFANNPELILPAVVPLPPAPSPAPTPSQLNS